MRALDLGVPKPAAAILVDEQFGAAIHEQARAAGIRRILTIEKSGQDEFDFQYGDRFGEHIERLQPEFVKVLVRYNTGGDQAMNERQAERLRTASDFCRRSGFKFLFELLVPATAQQLADVGSDPQRYERETRWKFMREAIAQLQVTGVEPLIWKIEGLEDLEQMRAVCDQTRADGRSQVGVVVLGRGESEAKVRVWLSTAAKIPGVVGFAVGRTVFKDALMRLRSGELSRADAVATIAAHYKSFVDLFAQARQV